MESFGKTITMPLEDYEQFIADLKWYREQYESLAERGVCPSEDKHTVVYADGSYHTYYNLQKDENVQLLQGELNRERRERAALMADLISSARRGRLAFLRLRKRFLVVGDVKTGK